MKACLLIFLLVLVSPFLAQAQEGTQARRVVLALYSSKDHSSPRQSLPHRFLEMPLNHLGYYQRYVDIEKPLPEIDESVGAIVIWIEPGRYVSDGDAYLTWLQNAVNNGRKLVIFDEIGLSDAFRRQAGVMDRLNALLSAIGMRDMDSFNSITYQGSILYQNSDIIGFERALPESLPPYQETIAIPGIGISHLKVLASKAPETIHDLVITGPGGGYVAGGYSIFEGYPILPIKEIEQQQHLREDERERPDPVHQWYIDPFAFLKLALAHEDTMPVPDVTTINGERIFYSHIDGDGWNNLTQIKKYAGKRMLSAEVIQREVLEAYPDIPVNVSVIAAEMDPECYGLNTSREVAKQIFRLPNVEPASHTYSHPLLWEFFEQYQPQTEASILKRYPPMPGRGGISNLIWGHDVKNAWDPYIKDKAPDKADFAHFLSKTNKGELYANQYYETPRSYACTPFDIRQELSGSIEYIKSLTPEEKRDRIRLIQWSGDTSPFAQALALTRQAGLYNINGGDSRYDSEYPSYASVSPIGAEIEGQRQIYSSNSNENTYTNLWTDRFFGFIYLQTTVRNTEVPKRVQPFNIYYHMYSGEKQASLAALRANMEFAQKQDIVRIFASDFAEIAESFYTTELFREGPQSWRIKNRGKLNTVRLDNAVLKAVDFARSKGVIGQRYYQGSLYISLDPEVDIPLLTLRDKKMFSLYPDEGKPYVISSTWLIKQLISVKKSLMFAAQGYGKGSISIKFPLPEAEYMVTAKHENVELLKENVMSNAQGIISLSLPAVAQQPLEIVITPVKNKEK